MNLRLRTVGTGVATLRPVKLRHLAGFCFASELGEDGDRWPDLAEVAAGDGHSAVIALSLDLLEESDPAPGRILLESLPDVQLVGIRFAEFVAPTRRSGRTGKSEEVSHVFAIEFGLAGEFADFDSSSCLFLFTSEILEPEIVLLVDYVASNVVLHDPGRGNDVSLKPGNPIPTQVGILTPTKLGNLIPT